MQRCLQRCELLAEDGSSADFYKVKLAFFLVAGVTVDEDYP